MSANIPANAPPSIQRLLRLPLGDVWSNPGIRSSDNPNGADSPALVNDPKIWLFE